MERRSPPPPPPTLKKLSSTSRSRNSRIWSLFTLLHHDYIHIHELKFWTIQPGYPLPHPITTTTPSLQPPPPLPVTSQLGDWRTSSLRTVAVCHYWPSNINKCLCHALWSWRVLLLTLATLLLHNSPTLPSPNQSTGQRGRIWHAALGPQSSRSNPSDHAWLLYIICPGGEWWTVCGMQIIYSWKGWFEKNPL